MIDATINFLKAHTFNVVVIISTMYLIRRFAMLFIKQLVKRTITTAAYKTEQDVQQRMSTLISTIGAGVKVAVWIIGGLLVLSELGIDIAPLLAGAGIAGVALGFGAQSMVRDFLSGTFILIENQYRVGDVIRLNNEVSGKVEKVTLRLTTLRDMDGMLHHIPNGEVRLATNMTMEFANVNMDITVSYEADLDKVEKIVNEVGKELSEDKKWKQDIFESPKFLRVENFADSGVVIKITGETAPMRHWSVSGELRKRLKIAFDKHSVVMPYPQRVIHQVSSKK
jgi:moderate conductance mechanosensitive channel